MALQFIFGNSGSGKSRYLYEQIIRESQDTPGEKLYCARAGAVYDADAAGAGTSASQQRHLKY